MKQTSCLSNFLSQQTINFIKFTYNLHILQERGLHFYIYILHITSKENSIRLEKVTVIS